MENDGWGESRGGETPQSPSVTAPLTQGSQGNGVPSPPLCKGRWIGIAETEGLPSFAGYTPQGNNPSVTSGDSSPYTGEPSERRTFASPV